MSQLELPSTWVWAKLGSIAEIIGGGTPNRDNLAYFQGNILWATPTDITKLNGLWIDKTSEMITQAGLDNSSAKLLPEGTVLMTSRASIGDTAINTIPMATNQGFANFICNAGLVFNEYLACWLPFIKQQLIQLASGTTFKEISKSTLSRIEIPLPPLPEQRRIAAILREADEIRRLRREANEKMQRIAEALFYDMFGDPETNPYEWNTTELEHVCVRITDGTHQPPPFESSGIPFLFISNIVEGKINLNTSKRISKETFDVLSKRCPVEFGDILYSTVGSYGVPVIVDTYQPFAFQRHIALIKPDLQLVHPHFLKAMLSTAYVKKQAAQRVRGSAQGTLNLNEIARYSIYVPPLDLQEKFVRLSNNMEDLIGANQIQSDEGLSLLHQSLLSRAFTGELTASWREQHAEELALAARERDALLQGQVTLPIETATSKLLAPPRRDERREDLIDQLSQLQQAILDVFVSDMQIYFTANQFHDDYEEKLREKGFSISQDRTKRELRTLAALGLIREVTLPVTDQPGRVAYATVYRYPQLEDETVNEDLALLATRSVTV